MILYDSLLFFNTWYGMSYNMLISLPLLVNTLKLVYNKADLYITVKQQLLNRWRINSWSFLINYI